MKGPNSLPVVEAAMDLRAVSPDRWDQFVKAMEDYSSQILSLTLSADPSLVMRAQGMAIQAAEIAQILRDAPRTYAQAQEAALKRAQNGKRTATDLPWPP